MAESKGNSTTGGAGGTTTTVTTLAEFSAAAIADGPGIIVVSGALSGAAKVQVGSDKTIVGEAGSCEFYSYFHTTTSMVP